MGAALAEGAFAPSAYAAASIVIWAAVIAGLVGRALPSAPVSAPAAAAGLCLAGIVLLAGASLSWASDDGRAFYEAVRASAYLGLFVLAACTASAGGRREWLAGLTWGLGAVSVLAVLSYLQPGLLASGELDQLIPGAAGRASYPIGYWNGLAALLALGAVLFAHSAVRAPARGLRAAALALLPVALLGIWLTSSRGGAIVILVGLAILLAASPDRPRLALSLLLGGAGAAALIGAAELMGDLGGGVDAARRADGDRITALAAVVAALTVWVGWSLDGRGLRPRLPRAAAIALGVAALVLAAVAIALADVPERFDEFRAPPEELSAGGGPAVSEDVNSSGRWQFWSEGASAFESAPVAGIGAGAYEDWWARNATLPVFVRNPHSLPLQGAAELGLIGAGLLAGFAAALGLAGYRRLAAGRGSGGGDGGLLVALIVTAALPALVDWTWAIPAVAAPAIVAAALLSASAPDRSGEAAHYWLGLATLALAWVALVAGGIVVLANLKLDQSRDAAAAGRYEEGIERAEEARTVEPWSPEPYTQLALLEEARGDPEAALERLDQARQRDSEDWRLALIEARLQRGRGDEAAARAALLRARELAPLLPVLVGAGEDGGR